MYKRFNVAVVCESQVHREQNTTVFMQYADCRMVRGKRLSADAVYLLIFECTECHATATIIDSVHV